MRSDTILVKTPRGREEIEMRAHELTAMQRRLLILVDGERTVGTMAEMLGRSGSDPVIVRDLKWLESGRYLDYAEELDMMA